MSIKFKGSFTLVILVSFCLIVTAALAQAQAPAAKTVVIGFTASQTGKLNVEGMRQINGLNLWIEKANAAGGVKLADGSVVKFAAKFYDDESNKGRVQELYTKLINDDKADFLVSPYSSGLADAAAVIAQQNNKILLTAGAASDSTYKKGFTMVYQTYTPASRYLTGAVDILAKVDPKAKNIAIVHEKDKFSTDVVNDLKKYAEGKGYKVVLFEGYDSGTTDFAPFINKIPQNIDAIMGGGHFADTSTLAKQIYEKGVKPKLVALLVAPPEPKFAELGDACVSIIGASQWEPAAKYSPEVAKAANIAWVGPTVKDFDTAYRSKYNEDPSYHSAGGYVAGLLIEQAIRQAGSTDTDKVKAELDKMDIATFYGNIKFDNSPANHGLQIGHEMVYIQWMKENGKYTKEIVWPANARTKNVIICYEDKKPFKQ